ncbi:hypothetical protein B0J14DRAFT_265562 [Halenospora varia]|nr:hypothetical protein B0J14DRAFT_265562 [Halenospora varia]
MLFLKQFLPAAFVATALAGPAPGLSITVYDDEHPSSIQAPFAEVIPAAPKLTYLYTAYLQCGASIAVGDGPKGTRSVIPIIGGNFTGPGISGTISKLGADWGLISDKNTFYADSRSNLVTDDGVNIYLQQSGTGGQGNGRTFLRMVYETGDPKYYWLNNVVAIGTLTLEGDLPGGGSAFKIEAFRMY